MSKLSKLDELMVQKYVNLIISGARTIEAVPKSLKEYIELDERYISHITRAEKAAEAD